MGIMKKILKLIKALVGIAIARSMMGKKKGIAACSHDGEKSHCSLQQFINPSSHVERAAKSLQCIPGEILKDL